jgi:hypothetical protein
LLVISLLFTFMILVALNRVGEPRTAPRCLARLRVAINVTQSGFARM